MKQGFTLIEVLVAIFILTVGVVGVFALINQALVSSSILINRLIASYLAQEGLEIMRNIRDTNWLESAAGAWDNGFPNAPCGVQYDKNSCPAAWADEYLKINNNGFYNHQNGIDTPFKRRISITKRDLTGDGDPDMMKVKVIVTWEGRGRTHTFMAQENIYNWLQ